MWLLLELFRGLFKGVYDRWSTDMENDEWEKGSTQASEDEIAEPPSRLL
jgi:hypothetical protein